MRLSELHPIDLTTLRAGSMRRVQAEIAAGWIRAASVEIDGVGRPVLVDGRHRVLVALRRGIATWPIVLTHYGPRRELRSREQVDLVLDALP